MRVAFITIEVPSLRKGAPVRVYNLIKQSVKKGMQVDLITLTDKDFDIEKLRSDLGINNIIAVPSVQLSYLAKLWSSLLDRIPPYFAEYRHSKLADAVLTYARNLKPDIIQFELLHSYDAVTHCIGELKRNNCKLILDAHNFEFRAFVDGISTFGFPKRSLGRYIASNILSIEQSAAKQVDHIFTCSEGDKKLFAEIVSEDKITVVPNGVDCEFFKKQLLVKDPILIFTGGTYYPPNNDGLRFYFKEIHTLVKEKIPNVKIYLLGGEPAGWLKKYINKDPGIIAPGLVPDVREYLQRARVCISPIRKGSGTSLKILEYMGSSRPIVSTTIGARGILCEDERDILIADDPKKFAGAVIRLLQDDELAIQLGENARHTVEVIYDWRNIGKRMLDKYNMIAEEV